MRIGERGVPTVEQWVEQEAAAIHSESTVAQTDPAASPPSPSPNQTVVEGGQGGAGEEAEAAETSVSAAVVYSSVSASGEGGGGEGGGEGFRLGVDPWLVSAGTARSLSAKLSEGGGRLVPIKG